MKNTINQLIRNLYYKIPPEILNEGFRRLRNETNRTLDALIKEYIIIDIVLMNCNLYAGKTKKIVLNERYGKSINDTTFQAAMSGNFGAYQIPPEARENRAITAVLDIAYPTTMALFGSFPNEVAGGRSVANGIDEALASFTHGPTYITPSVMLIDGDAGIIQLAPPAALHIDWILSCMLAYDKEFTNISPNMLTSLKNMTEWATKGFIYNNLYIQINQGYLQGGLQLEAIKSTIESYQDANEKFDQALLKFRGAATFTPESLREFCSLMCGS